MKNCLNKVFNILLLSFLMFGVAVGTMPTAAEAAGTNPQGVIMGIVDALNNGNVEGALALVADQAVVVLMPPPPTGSTYVGKEEIGAWWETFVSNQGSITVADFHAIGTMATWSATISENAFTTLGLESLTFDGVGIVHSGLLQSYTWIMREESLARFQAAIDIASNRVLAQRCMDELWNQGNVDLLDELVHEEFVSYAFPAGDRDALREAIIGFHAENPDGYFEIDDMLVTADRIIVRGGAVLTPEGASEPQRVDTFLLSMQVKDGKIADRWVAIVPAE